MKIDKKSILSSILVRRNDQIKNPVIISVLPLLSMLVAIIPGMLHHASGTETAKIGIVALILTSVVTFYIHFNYDSVLGRKCSKSIITIGYLGSICLLFLVPHPEVFCFWMIGGLLTAMQINNKLGLLFLFNMTFLMGIAINSRPEIVIRLLIISVLMSILSGALKNKATVIYGIIIILSVNVTLAFAVNNFIFEKAANYDYVSSVLSILAVLAAGYFIAVPFQKMDRIEAISTLPIGLQAAFEGKDTLQEYHLSEKPDAADQATVEEKGQETEQSTENSAEEDMSLQECAITAETAKDSADTKIQVEATADLGKQEGPTTAFTQQTGPTANFGQKIGSTADIVRHAETAADFGQQEGTATDTGRQEGTSEVSEMQEGKTEAVEKLERTAEASEKSEGTVEATGEAAGTAKDTEKREVVEASEQQEGTSYEVLCSLDHELLQLLNLFSESLYQHSIRIGDLSCRAAKEIGANELLAKAGGLYHEIGRINSKDYIEEGLKIAEDYAFPKELRAILKEHNIKYEKPSSVEAAIVMLSDNVVSTIDYIEKTGEHKYAASKIIENIFQMRFDKGNFDSSGLALKDYKVLREFYQREFSHETSN